VVDWKVRTAGTEAAGVEGLAGPGVGAGALVDVAMLLVDETVAAGGAAGATVPVPLQAAVSATASASVATRAVVARPARIRPIIGDPVCVEPATRLTTG
jgi:hypothetical protein